MDTEVSVKTTKGEDAPDIIPLPAVLTSSTVKQFLFEIFARFTSRKLWAFAFSVAICWLCLERGVNHLYALQIWQAATYGGMFLCVMGAIAAMACRYMGVEKVSYSASSNASGSIASSVENAYHKIEEKSEHTERIIDESSPNANLREFLE